MTRYLVVAHQTASSPELLFRVTEFARAEPEATFSILVPATPVQHLFTWEEDETLDVAQRTAEEAKLEFTRRGLKVRRTGVGDESPVNAISDELIERPGEYDAIILSTLPPGISRWLKLDYYSQADRQFDLPIIHVVAGIGTGAGAPRTKN